MITTGSKYLYGLALWLLIAAVVYGYATGGGNVGPVSLGYKGAVGDLVGYSLLMGGALISMTLGFFITAVRDADPDAEAQVAGLAAPPAVAPAGPSFWPVVGAFGAGLAVVGLVVNNVFFVAGLLALGAVAVEWTIQVWADRATGDPAVNKQIRNRIMFPVEVPLMGALAIGVVVLGVSRVLLTVSKENAVWVGIGLAAVVFVVGTALSAQSKLRTDLIAGLLVVFAVLVIGGGIYGAVEGERVIEHHGEEGADHADEGDDHAEDDGDDHADSEMEEASE